MGDAFTDTGVSRFDRKRRALWDWYYTTNDIKYLDELYEHYTERFPPGASIYRILSTRKSECKGLECELKYKWGTLLMLERDDTYFIDPKIRTIITTSYYFDDYILVYNIENDTLWKKTKSPANVNTLSRNNILIRKEKEKPISTVELKYQLKYEKDAYIGKLQQRKLKRNLMHIPTERIFELCLSKSVRQDKKELLQLEVEYLGYWNKDKLQGTYLETLCEVTDWVHEKLSKHLQLQPSTLTKREFVQGNSP